MLARLGVLWLIVFVCLLLPADDIAFYALMGVAFTITIPYSLWLRSKVRTVQFAPLQFAVDLVMVTGLIYFTGGAHSNFTLLFPLVILSAGIVGTPRQAAGITLLAVVIYALMIGALNGDLLPAYMPDGASPGTDASTEAIALRGLLFVMFGAASIYVAKRCDYIKAQERVLVTTTYTLLDNIPVPAMLLSEKGRILSANAPASYVLNTSREELTNRTFSELRQEPNQPIPEHFGHTAALLRDKASPLIVSYRTQDFHIPEAALFGSKRASKEPLNVTLLIFNDITEELKIRSQLDKVERITNATRIAGEMAHEIQGPLASLSASLQLLKHYESKATAADWLPNSPRRKDRAELFNHIEDASTRIDTSIKNFVDFAEFSPQDLLSIIKLDSIDEKQGYIGHLNTIGSDLKDGQNSYSG